MARHARLHVYDSVLKSGLIVTLQHPSAEVANKIAGALLDGGARVLEFLSRSEAALTVFRSLVEQVRARDSDAILGVGSIVDAPTAALYLAEGADFIVSPMLSPAIIELCHRRKIAVFPGCSTVSEISHAESLGVEIVKLFPSSAFDAAEFIKSLHGPMPWSRVMPTGNAVDCTKESVERWFKAGACALGTGSKLVPPQDIAAGRFGEIAARTEQMVGWIKAAR